MRPIVGEVAEVAGEVTEVKPAKKVKQTKKVKKVKESMRQAKGLCHDCDKSATFNYKGEQREYCASCRLPGMVDVTVKLCIVCEKPANFCDDAKNGFCADHAPPDCVFTWVTCDIPGCDRAPKYGICEGAPLRACELHTVPGMVKTCTEP
jgi:hypothetical protein